MLILLHCSLCHVVCSLDQLPVDIYLCIDFSRRSMKKVSKELLNSTHSSWIGQIVAIRLAIFESRRMEENENS